MSILSAPVDPQGRSAHVARHGASTLPGYRSEADSAGREPLERPPFTATGPVYTGRRAGRRMAA